MAVLHWQLQTMRGLVGRLKSVARELADGADVSDGWCERVVAQYLGFFCLRNHEYMQGQGWVAEMLYIHGKLLIVDDRVVTLILPLPTCHCTVSALVVAMRARWCRVTVLL